MNNGDKIIIGWQEIATLEDINLPVIKVKIDTGARTSSLHAENIKYFKRRGKEYVSFEVHPIQRNKQITVKCNAEVFDKRHVTSSSGCKEYRPVIKTALKIGSYIWQIELNLTKRDYMGFRMLLGRNAMQGNIIIDPEHKFLHGIMSKKQLKGFY